jgi:hypothetical protein
MFFSMIHVTSRLDAFPSFFPNLASFLGSVPGETGPGAGPPGGPPDRFGGPTELVF